MHYDQILNEFREAEDTEGMISCGQIEQPSSSVGNLLKFIYYNPMEPGRSRSMPDLCLNPLRSAMLHIALR
jgi:hypothetical protein